MKKCFEELKAHLSEDPKDEEEWVKASGAGALGGMIIGGLLGLAFGPAGLILGGVIGAIVGDQIERESIKRERGKRKT